jgi:hypothetical protein
MKRRGLGGLHTTTVVDVTELENVLPAKIARLYTGSYYKVNHNKNVQRLVHVGKAEKTARIAKQASGLAAITTFSFELADIQTRQRIDKKKPLEMTEEEAAARNRSLKDLGFYWRRAPY